MAGKGYLGLISDFVREHHIETKLMDNNH